MGIQFLAGEPRPLRRRTLYPAELQGHIYRLMYFNPRAVSCQVRRFLLKPLTMPPAGVINFNINRLEDGMNYLRTANEFFRFCFFGFIFKIARVHFAAPDVCRSVC